MKSIPDLCRALSDPEAERELREREQEFGTMLAEHVLGWEWRRSSVTGKRCLYHPKAAPSHMQEKASGSEKIVYDWGQMLFPSPWDICDAKTATDAMIARGWGMGLGTEGNSHYECELFLYKSSPLIETICVTAATEELARSACALLAALESQEKGK